MPLYEFECGSCGELFEMLVSPSETARCPACGAPDPKRRFSPISRHLKFGLRGTEARRSNALRQVREEQRRERRAQRRRKDS